MRTYYVSIDSRDRDRSKWPNANQFQVHFDPAPGFQGAAVQRSFKNVVCVELIHAILPSAASTTTDMYVNLHIPELDASVVETTHGTQCFSRLVLSNLNGTFVKSVADTTDDHSKKMFRVKGTRVDKLTVEFRDWQGQLINIGTDKAPPLAMDPTVQTSVLLRITVDDQMTI